MIEMQMFQKDHLYGNSEKKMTQMKQNYLFIHKMKNMRIALCWQSLCSLHFKGEDSEYCNFPTFLKTQQLCVLGSFDSTVSSIMCISALQHPEAEKHHYTIFLFFFIQDTV